MECSCVAHQGYEIPDLMPGMSRQEVQGSNRQPEVAAVRNFANTLSQRNELITANLQIHIAMRWS